MKTCTKCGEEKPLTEYPKDRTKKDGLFYWCRSCNGANTKRLQAANREEWSCLTDDEIRRYTTEKRCPSCERTLPSSAYSVSRSQKDGLESRCQTCSVIAQRKGVARKQGLPATLTWQEIGDPPDDCPACGQHMERCGDRRTSPSLDRLIPEDGYTAANAMWLCDRCNSAKQDMTPDQIYRLADYLYEVYRERGIACVTRLRPQKEEIE